METEFNNEIEILKKNQTKTIPEMKFLIRQIEVFGKPLWKVSSIGWIIQDRISQLEDKVEEIRSFN